MVNDAAQAKFLYTILKQLDLKTIDWNKVSDELEITNGHAARMRYSRFRSQMEGHTPVPRGSRRAAANRDTPTGSGSGNGKKGGGPKVKRQKLEPGLDDVDQREGHVKRETRIKSETIEDQIPSPGLGTSLRAGVAEDDFESVSPRTMPSFVPGQNQIIDPAQQIQTPATTPASAAASAACVMLKNEPDIEDDFMGSSDIDADADGDTDPDSLLPTPLGLDTRYSSMPPDATQNHLSNHSHAHMPLSSPGPHMHVQQYTSQSPLHSHPHPQQHAFMRINNNNNNLNTSFLSATTSTSAASSSQQEQDLFSSFHGSFEFNDNNNNNMGDETTLPFGSYLNMFHSSGSGGGIHNHHHHQGSGHGRIKVEEATWAEDYVHCVK